MKRLHGWIRRMLCLSLAFVTLSYTFGQQLSVKVGATYGVSAADDNKRVSDKYAAGQDTLPTGLYWAWQRWKSEGMPYATFRSRYLGCAIAKDIAWRYEAASNIKSGYQNTYAFADWTDASGHWYANATMQIPRGGMEGQGSFGHYDDTPTSQVFATCEFEMTEDWWPANQAERRLFETPNSSLGTPDAGSYNESFRIEGFRLQGPAIFGDGINRIGMFIRRPGECSYANQVFAYQFQTGIMIVGGVPFTFGTLSAFFNERHGFAFMGTWGATITGQTLSGDDNGELLGIHPGYGDEAGGIISINLLKNEAGIHAEGAGNPYRPHNVVYAEGQYSITIGAVAISRNWITTDAAFVINPKLVNGPPQLSTIRVLGMKGYNYKTLLQDLSTGQRWSAPPNSTGLIPSVSFVHRSEGNRMVINDQHTDTPGTPCNCPSLGFFRGNGTFDYVNCLPARTGGTTTTPVDPPPPPPPPPSNLTATALFPMDTTKTSLAKITDGNAGTFYLSGRSMTVGQWVQVDYGTTASRSSVSFDIANGYTNSFPRTFDVQVSTNGTAWTTVKAGAIGAYPTCSATFTAATVRYIRIVVKTANPNWWGVSAWR